VYLVSILPSSAKSGYHDKAYLGYAYALQYLWFVLLGEKRFEQSSLRYLHRAHEISFAELQNPNGRIKLPEEPKPNKIGLYALDAFFGRIGDEIVRPLEKQLNINIGFEPLLVFADKFEKGFISEFLKSEGLEEPEYLKSTSNEKLIKKKLD